MTTTPTVSEWRREWFEIADAAYLNTAAKAVMPRVALQAMQTSLEANRFPHRIDYNVFSKRQNEFGRPSRR